MFPVIEQVYGRFDRWYKGYCGHVGIKLVFRYLTAVERCNALSVFDQLHDGGSIRDRRRKIRLKSFFSAGCLKIQGIQMVCSVGAAVRDQSAALQHREGDLRYKIWNYADHYDHYYENWQDGSDGIHTTESLDLGQGERMYDTIRHQFDLKDFGLTEERLKELQEAGCQTNGKGSYETFDTPGTHLCLSYSRPCPLGGVETRSREWIGWRPVNGKLVRDERTYCTEEYLKTVVIHTLVEWEHLYTFLPELYAEYHDQPIDAD